MAQQTDRPTHWGSIRENALEILNVRHQIRTQETAAAAFVEHMGWALARRGFLLGVVVSHAAWILLNLPIYPWQPWDAYPFAFLAMVASVEAPLLALLILMHQQREQRINELREETSLQVSLHVERQTAMVLRLLRELQQQCDVHTEQDEGRIDEMQEYIDPQELVERLRRDLRRETDSDDATSP